MTNLSYFKVFINETLCLLRLHIILPRSSFGRRYYFTVINPCVGEIKVGEIIAVIIMSVGEINDVDAIIFLAK